jgi:hypothetical protein
VPAGIVVTWLMNSLANDFMSPKSAIFASRSPDRRMFLVFTSLWISGVWHGLCRYSNPASAPRKQVNCLKTGLALLAIGRTCFTSYLFIVNACKFYK